MHFSYHTDLTRPALIIAAPFLILALFPQVLLLRLVWLSVASGPLAWALLQGMRRGRTLRLYDDYLLIQRSLSGRVLRIPYAAIRGAIATRRGGLGLLYAQMPKAPAPTEGERSLLNAHPDPDLRPHQRVVITAKVDQIAALVEAITARQAAAGNEPPLPALHTRMLVSRRRRRDFLVALLLFLGIPLYMIVLTRLLSSFQ